ncbi:hypothetical protein [Chryseobacterium wanjuense]
MKKALLNNFSWINFFMGQSKKNYPNKNDIYISDPDHLISKESSSYTNRDIKIKINDNNSIKSDLYLKYYIINSDLAYVVFWTKTIEGISFVLIKSREDKSKWVIFDVNYKNIR